MIDDNSDHAESTATLLRLYGHLPEVAKDGAGRLDRSSPSVARRSADPYIEKLKALVKAKAKGEELVAPPDKEGAPIINLMDALKASLGDAVERPSRKMAASRKTRTGKKARRKRA